MKATQRIYRTAHDELVSEGDPRAAFLLAGVGDDIPAEYEAKAEILAEPAGDAEAPGSDDDTAHGEFVGEGEKQEHQPPNKARGRSGDKSKHDE